MINRKSILISALSALTEGIQMTYLSEPHEYVGTCDCRKCSIKQRDIAINMLAEWCVAVDQNGTGWDDWDEYYKDAMYRPGPLRERLDKEIAAVIARYKEFDHD